MLVQEITLAALATVGAIVAYIGLTKACAHLVRGLIAAHERRAERRQKERCRDRDEMFRSLVVYVHADGKTIVHLPLQKLAREYVEKVCSAKIAKAPRMQYSVVPNEGEFAYESIELTLTDPWGEG